MSAPAAGSPRQARFSRSFLIVLGVILGLAGAEGLLRVIGFEFGLFPSKVQFGWPDPVTLKDFYQVDTDLLWVSKDYDQRRNDWRQRRPALVFQGCSCTEFGGYPEYLAGIYAGHHAGWAPTIANAGVAGWSSYQGLKQLKRDILPLQPKVVTIFYGWNDHWLTFGIPDKDIGRFNLEYPTLIVDLSGFRLAQLASLVMFRTSPALSHLAESKTERVSPEDFSRNLTAMVQVARENGITPVLLTAPSSHQEGREPPFLQERFLRRLSDLVPLHQSYVKIVREVAARENAAIIDLEASLRQLPPDALTACFQEDGFHFSAAGGATVAKLIYEGFERLGINRALQESRQSPPAATGSE